MNRYDLLDAFDRMDEAQIEEAGRFFAVGEEPRPLKKPRRLARTLLLAAVIASLLGVTAYASGQFRLRGRQTEPEESFPVHFTMREGGDINGAWTGTYALEFDEPKECQPVRYRFGWLPDGLDLSRHYETEDGWVKRYDWEEGNVGVIPWCEHTELGSKERGLYLITDMYYAPQFVDGGALILLSAVPETVEEETWGELSVLRLQCKGWRSWKGEYTPYPDGSTASYVLLFHPEQGWIFAVRGDFPMEELEKLARNLEVEQTEGLVTPEQFENPYDFFDLGSG